jgi:hypothetical protein
MKQWRIILLIGIILSTQMQAQTNSTHQMSDSLKKSTAKSEKNIRKVQPDIVQQKTDSIIATEQKVDTSALAKQFKPNPSKAVIMAAIFPGLGQIYNQKYWKLPILYGGFVGFAYAISWNNRYYRDYFSGYKDIADDDPNTNSWQKFLRYGQDPQTVDKSWLTSVLKRRKDYYRRYRDLSIIGTVALYGLSIVDAYVDAQLFDFDISPDLTLHLQPAVIQRESFLSKDAYGIQLSFNFN